MVKFFWFYRNYRQAGLADESHILQIFICFNLYNSTQQIYFVFEEYVERFYLNFELFSELCPF